MEEVKKEVEEVAEKKEVTIDAEALAKFNQTHVTKEEYDKLLAEKNSMVQAMLNGEHLAQEEQLVNKPSLEELRNNVQKEDQTNLEYWENVLALRERTMEETGEDIFVASGHKITPTNEDYEAAERVANGMKDLIDRSLGDPTTFNSLYQKEVRDTTIPSKTAPSNAKR